MLGYREFALGDKTYRAKSLDAFKQLHIARRLAPVVNGLLDAWKSGGLPAQPTADEVWEALPKMLEPFGRAVSTLPDEDVDYVILTCLRAVSISQGGGAAWSPVVSPNGRLQFEDMPLAEMLQIVWNVIGADLGNFSSALASTSPGQGKTST